MGKVAFLCPRREVDRDRDGVCDLCPLMFQTAGGWDSMECVIDGNLFLLTCLLFIVSTLPPGKEKIQEVSQRLKKLAQEPSIYPSLRQTKGR